MKNRLKTLLVAVQQRALLLLAAYLAILFAGTHLPRETFEETSLSTADKLLHFLAYTVLGLLIALPLNRRDAAVRPRRIVLGLALAMAVAAVDELTQPLPGINRSCDIADWVADLIGASVGHLLYAWTRWSGVLQPLVVGRGGSEVA